MSRDMHRMCYSFFVTAAPEEPGFLKEANTTVTRLALDKFLKNTYILVVSKKAHSTGHHGQLVV